MMVPPLILGQEKNPTPEKNQGWDTNVFHGSTLLAAQSAAAR